MHHVTPQKAGYLYKKRRADNTSTNWQDLKRGRTIRVHYRNGEYDLAFTEDRGYHLIALDTTSDAIRRPTISPSAIDMYFKCGEQYRRRYIEQERIPPGISAHTGSGMHKAAHVNFKQKIESFRDLKEGEAADIAVAEFETRLDRDGCVMTPEEASRGLTAIVSEEKDRVALLSRAFMTLQAPDYQPVATEQWIRIELPDSTHDINGIVDLIDSLHRVPDFKTTRRKFAARDVAHSTQLTYYAAAVRKETGVNPTEVRLDVLVSRKKAIDRQLLAAAREQQDYQVLLNRVNTVLSGIQKGNYPPAPPSAWWCDPRYCGYWQTCPYVNAERAALREEVTSMEV